MKQFIFLCIIFLSVSILSAQKEVSFGKIDMADLKMTTYDLDTNAKAVILYDMGYTDLEYNTARGFQYTFERHVRIKILDKNKLDLANFSIPLYEENNERENVIKFKGNTYTLVKGKVEETSVNKKDLFKEQTSENQSKETIAMPKVQVGSIIELKYTVVSPFFWNLHDWQYQYEIPVRYSEYRINYPEWFDYNVKFKGYDLQHIKALNLNPDNRSITFNSIRRSGNMVVNSQHVSQKVDYKRLKYGWIAENMPGFEDEEYISSLENFLVKVTFELSSTSFPGSPWQSYVNSWDALGKTMRESNNFGKQLTKGRTKFLSNEAKALAATVSSDEEKIAAIYYHLKNKVAWNGDFGIFVTENLKTIYENGKGSVADVNLLLIAMLRQSGFSVEPVLLSTKKHGFLRSDFPAISQFNYVIAKVNFGDGKAVLLDATNRGLPINLLPTRCLNDRGLIVGAERIGWTNLQPTGKNSISQSLNLSLNEDLEWVGTSKVRCKDYAASNMRYEYYEEDETVYLDNLASKNEGLNIRNYSVEGLEQIGKGVKESFDVDFSNHIIDGGELLYFNPMLTYAVKENPFKLEERIYPVDFHIPISRVQSFQYEIPEGYTVDEIPEKKVIALPDQAGNFSYSAKVQSGKIMVISQFKINKTLFLPEEYQALKEFYNIVVAKHAEQVVLKKA